MLAKANDDVRCKIGKRRLRFDVSAFVLIACASTLVAAEGSISRGHPLYKHLQLVDWTGRQLHPGKRVEISKDVPSVIERLGSTAEIWVHFVKKFSGRRNVQSVTRVNQQAVAHCLQSTARASV